MSIDPRRLLGLAFTAGDLLLELAPDGRVLLALGASQTVLGPDAGPPTGRDCRDLVAAADRPMVDALLLAADDGARRACGPLRLACGQRAAMLHARALPDNDGRVSCALSPASPPRTGEADDGLHTRDAFESLARDMAEAARGAGVRLELALVELAGLAEAGPEANARAAGALRLEAEGGVAAARLAPERFALLRQQGEDTAALARRLSRALAAAEQPVQASARAVSLTALSPARLAQALRTGLESFIADGLAGEPVASLAEVMDRSVRRALSQAGELGIAVSERRFDLAFQPVVRMADGMLHHHEVLVRFEQNHSPFALVQMAEAFDLIEELDRAVVEQVVRRLRADRRGTERLAVNVSGRTITSPGFVAEVEALVKAAPGLSGRLLFEITESAAIDDLTLADRHVQALRGLGSLICLDDFGAGAASLGYLQRLSVDIVKIDGRYVRDLVVGGRDAALLRHIVNLCRDLGVQTVAEMVETPEIEEAARTAGVDYGQGWLYGRPAARPEAPPPRAASIVASRARRTGLRSEWG